MFYYTTFLGDAKEVQSTVSTLPGGFRLKKYTKNQVRVSKLLARSTIFNSVKIGIIKPSPKLANRNSAARLYFPIYFQYFLALENFIKVKTQEN